MKEEAAIEQEIVTKGLTAPRITPEDLDAQIVGEAYHVFPGSLTTVCELTMKNGFKVTGISACVHPKNFNAEIGRSIARSNARDLMWPLLGYELKNRLYLEEAQKSMSFKDRLVSEALELDKKLSKLKTFLGGAAKDVVGEKQYGLLMEQATVMGEYLLILDKRLEDLK